MSQLFGCPMADAGEYGNIIRFKIFQMDRIDIWSHTYQYFERDHWECISPGFLKPENNVCGLIQALYDDFFAKASDEFQGLEGAMLELYASEIRGVKRRFLKKEDLPKLKVLLEQYLPEQYIPKFLYEDQSINGVTDWWDYSEFWSEGEKKNLA